MNTHSAKYSRLTGKRSKHGEARIHHTLQADQWMAGRRMLAIALAVALLIACGGGDDDDKGRGTAQLRLINATADVNAIDLTVDGESSDEARPFTAVARDGQSEFVNLGSDTYTLRGKRAGEAATLALNASTLEAGKHYTALVYGRDGDYRAYAAVEDQVEPTPGKAMLRVFNAAPDAGSVDVYLTEGNASLDNATPTVAGADAARLSSYSPLDRGTWRLRITGRGDPRDLRLDVAAFELADKARTTLVLQPGVGGVLVHALISQHRGALASTKNTHARVRLAAGVAGGAGVSASVANVPLNVNLRSPSVGAYTLVPAGPATPAVSVNGTAVPGPTRTFLAGGDHTLAVYGAADAAEWRLVQDRNQLPLSAERARMRLLHMAPDVDGQITLSKDFVAVTFDNFLANPHIYAPVTAGPAPTRLEASSPLFEQPLLLNENALLATRGVYTVFVMTGPTRPVGMVRRDR